MGHTVGGILVHPEELTCSWIDRMSSAGLDLLGLHPRGGRAAAETLKTAIAEFDLPQTRALREYARQKGIAVEYEAHSMGELFPRDLFSSHPEYYRVNSAGDRTPDVNLCASNADALAIVSDNAMRLAKRLYTGTHNYSFWIDDTKDGACHCADCSRLSPADQALRVTNAIADGIRRFDADAVVYHLAYHETVALPTKTEPARGVRLEYAPINRDFHAPINDMTNEKNVNESAPVRDLISFFGKKNSKVLEYWMDNSLYSNWTKPPKKFTLDEAVLASDVEFYDSLGFEIITSFGCYLGPDYEELYGMPSLDAYGRILTGKII